MRLLECGVPELNVKLMEMGVSEVKEKVALAAIIVWDTPLMSTVETEGEPDQEATMVPESMVPEAFGHRYLTMTVGALPVQLAEVKGFQ